MDLIQIQTEIQGRVAEIVAAHPGWPCRKGCDDCCRSLASPPRVTRAEWEGIAAALRQFSPDRIAQLLERTENPRVCPLLDPQAGTCTVYEVRPIACRTYGFYAERQFVLGCSRIEHVDATTPGIVWGNQASVDARLQSEFGESLTFAEWLLKGDL